MQRHADEGARIIDRLGFLNDAVPAIRHHHERFDGTGYPDRLAGEEIPLGARIIHVADALDSMLTTRIYRAARPARRGARGASTRAPARSSARAAWPRSSGSSRRSSADGRAPVARPLARAVVLADAHASRCSAALAASPSVLYTACMARGRRHPAVAGIDPRGARGLPGRASASATPTSEILDELRASAERLGARRRCASSRRTRRRRCIRRR